VSLSTHVLDASTGTPAEGVTVALEQRTKFGWQAVTEQRTDVDGRVRDLGAPTTGVHRISFDTGRYFAERGVPTFYPQVTISFEVTDPQAHYHVPLLLSAFAYSTYRGS
jgi:5-hydroxyisourate hydrolase